MARSLRGRIGRRTAHPPDPNRERVNPVTEAPHDPPSRELVDLARHFGVATEYWSWTGEHVLVPASTVRAVLAALGVDAGTDAAALQALQAAKEEPWRRVLPPVVVTRAGWTPWVPVHVPHNSAVQVWVELEGGGRRDLGQREHWVEPKVIDGAQVGEATFEVPADLPLGWHRLMARQGARTTSCPLVVTPDRLELPPALSGESRGWGFMTQLYSVRSRRSWGIGGLDDLAE